MITISKAKPEETSEIKKLLMDTWLDTNSAYMPPEMIKNVFSVWFNSKLIASQIKNPNYFYGVAKNENVEIVGLAVLKKLSSAAVKMHRLYILPHYQKQGIGTELLKQSLPFFPGTKSVELEVEESNNKGLSFYLKHGFTETARREVKIKKDIMKVRVLKKEIA